MAITVEFLGPINKENITLSVDSLKALANHLKDDPIVSPWLDKSAIAINGNIVKDINHHLKEHDVVSILPPVCGG